jgi:hypothetical protein
VCVQGTHSNDAYRDTLRLSENGRVHVITFSQCAATARVCVCHHISARASRRCSPRITDFVRADGLVRRRQGKGEGNMGRGVIMTEH